MFRKHICTSVNREETKENTGSQTAPTPSENLKELLNFLSSFSYKERIWVVCFSILMRIMLREGCVGNSR